MSTKAIIFASIVAFTSALPSYGKNTETTECWRTNPGTSFYRCANGNIGCFAYDPCGPQVSSTTPPTTVPNVTPTPTTVPSAKYTLTQPRSYNIYPLNEALHDSEDPVSHVDLLKVANGGIVTTNAMVFENIPAGAKNCFLGWNSTVPGGENDFKVTGKGQASRRQLTGFPTSEEKVSFNSLKKYQDNSAEWSQSLDFTGWVESPGTHGSGFLKCGEQVALEIKGSDDGEGENRVFITNTEDNGFFLTYEV
ncbi:unnamed protein product [Periconia digitata]|uniref:Ubiquitin 3 binding protein But2 C-terminal domain-containing protein n=1 Tax=Periconia digitata TaxID=1303443 RepID=A0A9W4XP36_9PLEO|nr:unnamed protein product [Periconia digitata]